jgi:Bacterial pre-peptidase C-terminal domain
MKRIFFLLLLSSLAFSACYSPELNDEPFACGGTHGDGICPDGFSCYGGMCLDSMPVCWQDNFFGTISGADDNDFEPNNTPDLAYMMQCGDTLERNIASCPQRFDITRTYLNLAVCGEGDIDIYKIYLVAGEQIDIVMKYNYGQGLDLDMVLFHSTINPSDGSFSYNLSTPDQQSVSTNDDENITLNSTVTGWYYLMVYGKTIADINGYALQWTLLDPQVTE